MMTGWVNKCIAIYSPDLNELNSSLVYSLPTILWVAGKTLRWWVNLGGL